MTRLASIDGILRQPEEATVSVYDRGFLYGDSVFETIRTYGGEPYALAEHMARLERSAARVGIDMPIPAADFAMEVRVAVRAARNPESYARAMLTRGAGPVGLDPALAVAPLRVVLVEPLVTPPAALYRDGVKVVTVRTERAADAAHGAKVGNYLASLLALKHAKAHGAHEALILDAGGRVIEGTTSNVFLVREGALITPPEEAGILPGITRAHLIEVAAERRLPVRFSAVTLRDLVTAEEVFITSSIREIIPVVRVDDDVIGDGRPGRVTRALHESFRTRVGLAAEPMPWE
ncbi:Branched-chain amino acid aminotransferase [Minicystis rosea]|nr:Branched-chain amino acid aminotransferase [Minicystis rosea]